MALELAHEEGASIVAAPSLRMHAAVLAGFPALLGVMVRMGVLAGAASVATWCVAAVMAAGLALLASCARSDPGPGDPD